MRFIGKRNELYLPLPFQPKAKTLLPMTVLVRCTDSFVVSGRTQMS